MNPTSRNSRFRSQSRSCCRSRSPLPSLRYLTDSPSPPPAASAQPLYHRQKFSSRGAEAPTRFQRNERLVDKRSPLPPAREAHTQTSLAPHPPSLPLTCKTSLLQGSGSTVPQSSTQVSDPNRGNRGQTSAQGRAREINSGAGGYGAEKDLPPFWGGHVTPDKAGYQGHTIATQVPRPYKSQAPDKGPCDSQRPTKARLAAATAPWLIETSGPLFTVGVTPWRQRGAKPHRRPHHRPSHLARQNPFNIRKKFVTPKPPPPRMRWGRSEEPPPSKLQCLEAQEPDPMEEAMEQQWSGFKKSQGVHILENNPQPLTTSRPAGGTPCLQQRLVCPVDTTNLMRTIIVPSVAPPMPPNSGQRQGVWRNPDNSLSGLMPGSGALAGNVAFGPAAKATLAAAGRSESPMDISVEESSSSPPARKPHLPAATNQKMSRLSTPTSAADSGKLRESESDSDSECKMDCECSGSWSVSPLGGLGKDSGGTKTPLRASQLACHSTTSARKSSTYQTLPRKSKEKNLVSSDEEMDLS